RDCGNDAIFLFHGIFCLPNMEYGDLIPFYLTGVYLWKLPIEEWLFFICIPYALYIYIPCISHLSSKTYSQRKSIQRST
ncbi:hypothetical protein ACFPGN_25280, partial [Aquimarina hainanensis]